MSRAAKMCGSCPFRGADDAYKLESASIPAIDWPCHTEDMYGDYGIQCRGHWEAVRRFGQSAQPPENIQIPFSLAQPA